MNIQNFLAEHFVYDETTDIYDKSNLDKLPTFYKLVLDNPAKLSTFLKSVI